MMIGVTREPSREIINALQNITFTCNAKGLDVKYEWKRYGNSSVIGRQSTLTISEAIPSDSDQYYCVAMNKEGSVRSINVTLTVNGENAVNYRPTVRRGILSAHFV